MRHQLSRVQYLLVPVLILATPLSRAQSLPTTSSASATKNVLLEEIVVSARKKDELLTEVPASITAYSSEFLQRQNIQSFTDYATKIPNLTFQYGQGGQFLWAGDRTTTIRGVVGAGTTAYYINDTPVPASVSPQTLNLDRIEVLKGPQGTLFGASSMGGNLRFITKKPSLTDNSGAIQVQGGNTKNGGLDFDGNAQGTFVLSPDRLALDTAFGYTRESGFVARRFADASGQLVTKDDQGRSDTFSGALTLRFAASDSLEMTASVLAQISNLHGFPAAYLPLPEYKPVSYTSDRAVDIQEYSKDRWGMGSFVLNYAGQGFAVVSSTSYFLRRIEEKEDETEGMRVVFDRDLAEQYPDLDLSNSPYYTLSISKTRLLTQEVHLSFEDGWLMPKLSGITGAYYQRDDGKGVVPPIPMQVLTDNGHYPDYFSEVSSTNHQIDTALFGELYYEIIPKLTATVGLRKYWLTQVFDPYTSSGFGSVDGIEYTAGTKRKESGLVPKGALSYKVGNNGNVYISASKGFRPGGSQGLLPVLCEDDLDVIGLRRQDLLSYKSDTLWNYEIGAKSQFADGRANASVAAFQIDWSDIQQTGFLPTCGMPFTTNAGKARIRGGEVEIGGAPFADLPLSLQLGLGYTHSALTDPGVMQQDPNTPLAGVPQWSGSMAGSYETPINNEVTLFMAADYSYTDSVRIASGEGGFVGRQPFNIVNGNIGVRFGRSELMLYGKNLLDKRLNFGDQPGAGFEQLDESGRRLPRGVVSRPRQLGLQYQITF